MLKYCSVASFILLLIVQEAANAQRQSPASDADEDVTATEASIKPKWHEKLIWRIIIIVAIAILLILLIIMIRYCFFMSKKTQVSEVKEAKSFDYLSPGDAQNPVLMSNDMAAPKPTDPLQQEQQRQKKEIDIEKSAPVEPKSVDQSKSIDNPKEPAVALTPAPATLQPVVNFAAKGKRVSIEDDETDRRELFEQIERIVDLTPKSSRTTTTTFSEKWVLKYITYFTMSTILFMTTIM